MYYDIETVFPLENKKNNAFLGGIRTRVARHVHPV